MTECKVSRSEFLADKHKPWREKPGLGIGAVRSYLMERIKGEQK